MTLQYWQQGTTPVPPTERADIEFIDLYTHNQEEGIQWAPSLPPTTADPHDPTWINDPYVRIMRGGLSGSFNPLNLRAYTSMKALAETAPRVYHTESEDTGIVGLLRLALMSDEIFPTEKGKLAPNFENVLLVGSITWVSFERLLTFLSFKGDSSATVTLLDAQPYTIREIELMIKKGNLNWPGEIRLNVEPIENHSTQNPYNLVVTDILSPYIVQAHWAYDQSHLEKLWDAYSEVLEKISQITAPGGYFLSRNFHRTPPDIFNHSTPTPEKVEAAMNRISRATGFTLGGEVDFGRTRLALTSPWPPIPEPERDGMLYKLGPESESVVDQMMEEKWPGSVSTKVTVESNKPPYTFYSYFARKT